MDRNLSPNPDESQPGYDIEPEQHLDRSADHVARVRAAREAAQHEIDAFGDVAEYEIRKVYGQHASLDYGNEPTHETPENKHASAQIPPDRHNDAEEEHVPDNGQAELDFDAREHKADGGHDEPPLVGEEI